MSEKVRAQGATIRADEIKVDEHPIRRRNKHKSSKIVAKKNVSVEITKQHPDHKQSSDEYPANGTIIEADNAVIHTRMAVNKKPSQEGKHKRLNIDRGFDADVSGNVRRRRKQ